MEIESYESLKAKVEDRGRALVKLTNRLKERDERL